MDSKFKVRDFREADLDTVVGFKEESMKISFPGQKLDKEKFRDIILKKTKADPESIKILEKESKPVGYIKMSIKNTAVGKYGVIDHVFVENQYRRSGIGTMLMKTAEDYFKKHKVKRIRVKITKNNKASLALCKRLGYEEKRLILEKEI